ncbi:MAG: glycerol kinase GlpK [Candidatus Eisenbacteria bacterium]|uniref:Glycerol kinase n=1 Tax=Eiseniibacteriota bacterium TaxID=2212470 RepID=A0A933SB52_UNCEI|nr:glycerol kinase GlpK [Candidatus Eisenbacteria bacterium]
MILAIDQGTTGTTALVLDRKGRVRGRGYAELPQHFPKPGWVEHDPDEIWASVLAAVPRALAAARVKSASIRAIGVTNQRETVVLWDRTTGEPVCRAIVWQDRRTAERCAKLQRTHGAAIRRATGLVCDPYFSATKLEWLLAHEPRARKLAAAGRLAFGTVDSWLVWKLTGGAVHATDPTNASRTMLFGLRSLKWDRALLARFGVPANVLPEVRPSAGDFGFTRGVRGLPDGIAVAGVAGDQQAALFGQGCVKRGQSKNTYGTGCFLLLHTGDRIVHSNAGLLTTVACDATGGAAYALEGSVFIAGAAIQWLRDGLGLFPRAADSEALARSVPDSGGVVMIPAFAGLGAPYWRADVRGALLGLTRGTTRAHVARAALESLAFQSRDLVEAMASDAGARVTALQVDGGAVANDLLMQWQTDVLGIPVRRPRVIETTALGAGLLAGLATGFWSSHRELDSARTIEREFRPKESRAWREREYARWKQAVATLLG